MRFRVPTPHPQAAELSKLRDMLNQAEAAAKRAQRDLEVEKQARSKTEARLSMARAAAGGGAAADPEAAKEAIVKACVPRGHRCPRLFRGRHPCRPLPPPPQVPLALSVTSPE